MVDGKGDVARGWPLGITCFFLDVVAFAAIASKGKYRRAVM